MQEIWRGRTNFFLLAAEFLFPHQHDICLEYLLEREHFSFHTAPKAPESSLLIMGSVVLPHLVTGWHVDQAIMSEEDRLVVIRFGRDWDPDCMRQDEVLYRTLTFFPRSHPSSTNTPPQE